MRKPTSPVVDPVWLFETTPSPYSSISKPSLKLQAFYGPPVFVPCSPNMTSARHSGLICALHFGSPRRHAGVMIAFPPRNGEAPRSSLHHSFSYPMKRGTIQSSSVCYTEASSEPESRLRGQSPLANKSYRQMNLIKLNCLVDAGEAGLSLARGDFRDKPWMQRCLLTWWCALDR